MENIKELKSELDDLMNFMPMSFEAKRLRDQQVFEVSKEIEAIENPESYLRNIKHWEV